MPAAGSEEPRRLTSGTRDQHRRAGRRTASGWRSCARSSATARTAAADLRAVARRRRSARRSPILPRGAGAPAWSPDGTRIAFSSATTSRRRTDPRRPATAPKSDVRVITSAVYRANGGGWNDPSSPSHHLGHDVAPGTAEMRESAAADPGKYARRRAWRGRPMDRGSTSRPTASTRRFFQQRLAICTAVPAARRRDDEDRRASTARSAIRRASPDGKSTRVRRHAQRHAGALVRSARSVRRDRRRTAVGDAAQPHRELRLRHRRERSAAIRPRRAAAARAAPIWSADGASILIVAGEQGDANLLRVDAASGQPTPVLKGAHTVQSYSASRGRQDARRPGRRPRRTSATCSCSMRHEAGPASIRAGRSRTINDDALQDAEAERAGRSVVDELRRQEDPGLGAASARLRPVEEVSVHPRDPRRPALGVRQRLHARVPVHGGARLRRALPEPARQQQLRAGLRQHHPVPLPRRRLQGPDGGRGR